MREAIQFPLEGMREDGTPIPFPSTVAAEEMAIKTDATSPVIQLQLAFSQEFGARRPGAGRVVFV